jgi:hypothetical protein
MTLLHPEQDEANSGFSVLQFGQIAISSRTGVRTPKNWVNYVVCEAALQLLRPRISPCRYIEVMFKRVSRTPAN